MTVKKLSKECLAAWVDSLVLTDKVIGVKARGDRFEYGVLESAKDLRLDFDVTLGSPKVIFQPPRETLVTFDAGGYKSFVDDEPFIVIGVHPYDMIALNQMDKLWSQDNCDVHYLHRRSNATIIACDVVKASRDVFASSMGTAVVKTGFDILLTNIGSGYLAQAATDKGKALLAKAAGAEKATEADLKKREEVWEHNSTKLNKHHLKCKPSDIPKLLEKGYSHPIWEEKAKTCFSCGSCNTVCPTCYCFNVQDDFNWDLKSGKRERCWDGCLLDAFTKVAGNHEFRKNRLERFRHRLYRKGMYVPAKIGGEIACVGCGRCVHACLPDIANPVNVYNRLVDDLK